MAFDVDAYNFDEGQEEIVKYYTADFETTTDPNDCRVWAYCICNIDDINDLTYGNDISDFIIWCWKNPRTRIYFHNLAFDGSFIIDYLERNGWKWTNNKEEYGAFTYSTLISDMNLVYSITLHINKCDNVTLYDSYKIIPLSISDMARAYKLDIQKETLDYEAYREKGHILTEEEKIYISHDVQIAAKVLKLFLDNNLKKMTAGSNALSNYKSTIGTAKAFRTFYPVISKDKDEFLRAAYRGGFTYVNPKFAGKEINNGIVLDVNSLYPSVMYGCDGQVMPYGEPEWFDGKYDEKYKESYPLWIASVNCYFKVKENHIPSIQLKHNHMFSSNEYITDSQTVITFCLTNVDWELMQQQYDIFYIKWNGGFMFKANNYMFKDYIDYWINEKNTATIEGNAGKRQIAKLMLNSLYGKFATRMNVVSRRPILENDVIRYVDLPEEEKEPVYLPVGIFVTSYARYKTITAAQFLYDRFIYADTDSLHLIDTELPTNLDIDNVKLGAWKHESTFDRAKFLRQKCYIEHEIGSDNITVHVAGMPKNMHSQVTFDNFKLGAEYDGKLYQHRVNGGIVLAPDKMVIRDTLL